MPDKFRKTAPLKITFVDGEQPTAAKLGAVATQSRNGLELLEKAIGDPWNQSGEAILTAGFPLQIPNLARYAGENSLLNPALVPTTTEFQYTESIGVTFADKNTGYLRFPPEFGSVDESGVPDTHFTKTGDTSSNFTTPVDNEFDVDAAGKYWIEKDTGKFRTFGVLDSGVKLIYIVDPVANWLPGQENLPGIIPDVRQTEFTSCRVEENGGKFYLHLPPRRPLTLDSRERPDNYPPASEEADNEQGTGGIAIKQYWSDGVDALTGAGDEHYRYALPKQIQDATLAEGAVLPAGLLYVWDTSNNTIIDDVVFRWPDATRVNLAVEVESATFDFSDAAIVSADELEASYSKTNLVLITLGSSLASAVWSQTSMYLQHRHDNQGTMEATIQHKDLRDLNPPTSDATLTGEDYEGHDARYPSGVAPWPPSRWAYDDHTSLLSRAGSQINAARIRDIHNNAMLGDLILANNLPANYLDEFLPDNSVKIVFGNYGGLEILGQPDSKLHFLVSGVNSFTVGGTAGAGAEGLGRTDGVGLLGTGALNGAGVAGTGGSSDATGVTGTGGGTQGRGVEGFGQGAQPGIYGTTVGGGNGPGVQGVGGGTTSRGGIFTGSGTAVGIQGTGGTTSGDGGQFTGGAPNGIGVDANGTGTGHGVVADGGSSGGDGVRTTGGGTAPGLRATGGSGGADGIIATGTTTNDGVQGTGGPTDGLGGNFTGGGTNGIGLLGTGAGTGAGVTGTGGGTDAAGGSFTGGTTNGIGALGTGTGSGVGVSGVGDTGAGVLGTSSTGVGVSGTGGTSASGGDFTGGASDGIGCSATGGATNGRGGIFVGTGSGVALEGTSSAATGYAVIANAATTPVRSALRIVPQNSDPGTTAQGDHYVSSETGLLRGHNGTAWARYLGNVHAITATENETTAVPFATSDYTLPANTLSVGSTMRVVAAGSINYSSGGPTTVALEITFDGNQAARISASISGSGEWRLESTLTVRSIGASGAIWAAGSGMYDNPTTVNLQSNSFTADTTGAIVVGVDLATFLISGSVDLDVFTIDMT
jgi:hypothetical protein